MQCLYFVSLTAVVLPLLWLRLPPAWGSPRLGEGATHPRRSWGVDHSTAWPRHRPSPLDSQAARSDSYSREHPTWHARRNDQCFQPKRRIALVWSKQPPPPPGLPDISTSTENVPARHRCAATKAKTRKPNLAMVGGFCLCHRILAAGAARQRVDERVIQKPPPPCKDVSHRSDVKTQLLMFRANSQ